MASDSEIGRVVWLVKRFGDIPGKLAIQKVIYFFEVFGGQLDYGFKWFPLGPYSPDLASDVTFLTREGSLRIDSSRFRMALADSAPLQDYYLKVAKVSERDENAIRKCLEFLKDKTPQQLELLSSVHFVCKNFVREGRKDECVRELLRHKSKFSEDDARRAWDELRQRQLV